MYDLNIEKIPFKIREKRRDDLSSLLTILKEGGEYHFQDYAWGEDKEHQEDLDRVFPLREGLYESVHSLYLLYYLTAVPEPSRTKVKTSKLKTLELKDRVEFEDEEEFEYNTMDESYDYLDEVDEDIEDEGEFETEEEEEIEEEDEDYKLQEFDVSNPEVELDEQEYINYKDFQFRRYFLSFMLGFELAVYRKDKGYEDKNLNWQKGYTDKQFEVWQLSQLFYKDHGKFAFIGERLGISYQAVSKRLKAMQNKRDKFVNDTIQFLEDCRWDKKPTTKRGRKLKKMHDENPEQFEAELKPWIETILKLKIK